MRLVTNPVRSWAVRSGPTGPVGVIATRARSRVREWAATLRRIIGAPDYDAYVAHQRRHHPGCPVLSERDFMRERLEDRYSRPGARCC